MEKLFIMSMRQRRNRLRKKSKEIILREKNIFTSTGWSTSTEKAAYHSFKYREEKINRTYLI